jgi:hypothetical protein
MKWALQYFTDWFTEAQMQLGTDVSLVLLLYRRAHRLEPEVIKDVVKHLKGTQNTISKHVGNFRVNTKMAGEGKSYPMYLKLRVGTNVFGENLSQLILDLKSVSSDVAVFKSTMQKADVVMLGWLKNSHRNLDLTWLTNWANNIAVQLSAGTCKNSLPGLDKDAFKGRDPIELGFQWKAVLDGYNKDTRAKANKKQDYAVHVLAEKKDRSLANALVVSLIVSPAMFRSSALEFRMAPLYQRENGPAERLKFLESLNEHVKLQNKLVTAVIPDLQSLDIRAPSVEEQSRTADDPDDSATAIAEKRNPTARTCIMSIQKKGMPGVPLFADIGTSFFGEEYIATYAEKFKEEASFVASNMAAILYHLKGEVGLSFFPEYVRTEVRKQGWNEAEDRPVTAGEVLLDATMKPYDEKSNMLKLFDFSAMEETPLKDDLQQNTRPAKNDAAAPNDTATGDSPALPPRQLTYRDAFLVQSKVSAFVNPDGTKRVASATQRESYGNDDTTLGSNPRGDETIATEDEKADGVEGTDNDELMEEVTINSTQTNRTSKSFRSARSLARERQQIEDRAQFNAALVNIQDHNRLQQEASRKEIEELKLQLQRQNITQPPVTQPTPTGESIETSTNSSISSKEEEDEEDEELMEAQDWMQRNNIPLPTTKEEEEETPPADPPNDESENGAEESPPPAL